jgi:HAD superfamily hydrolase (TIGR01509 family)
MKQTFKKIILLFAVVSMSIIQADFILLDIGGTVGDVYKPTYAIQELGIPNILLHGLTNNFQFNPQVKMFATLDKIDPRTAQEQHEAITHEKAALPKIYCDWMAGKYANAQETRAMILGKIDQYYQQEDFFNSYFEYIVVRNAIEAMFTPEKLVKHQYAIEPMLKLIERIDPTKHTIVIVSNWDQHSYPLFLESPTGQRLCKLVKAENMIVSGFIGYNKPHTEFYNEIFKRYGTPEVTKYLFIDNEPVNIKSAQALGIPSVHYTGDHTVVEQELISRGIITAD